MPEYDKTPLDREPIGAEFPARRGEGPNVGLIVGIVLAVLAAAAGWFWYRGRAAPAPAVQAAAAPAPAAPAATAEPAVPLPDLDASDAALRDWVARLSAHPELAAWLVNDDLARRFVAAVVAVAEGTSPSRHVAFLAPAEPFRVRTSGGRTYIDAASFRRYDLATDVFASLDERGTAELFRRIAPLLDEAYLEVGDPQRTFEETLERAIANLLAVPVPAAPVEVTAASVSYTWADHDLEGRTLAEKHLLRLGPENATRVQSKLRALAKAMELQVPG
jgi:hypothetical protein